MRREIVQFSPALLEDVLTLYHRELPNDLLSKMGRDFSEIFFEAILADPTAFGFVWLEHSTVAGFGTATTDNLNLRKTIFRRFRLRLIKAFIKLLFTKPGLIRQSFVAINVSCNRKIRAEFIILAVDKRFRDICFAKERGISIANELFLVKAQELMRRGASTAQVPIGADNLLMNMKARKYGWRIYSEFVLDGHKHYMYQVNLVDFINRVRNGD